MSFLILGLLLFLGTHSIRMIADDWRTRQIARLGERPWKALYALVSLLGFVLLVWGYGLTRDAPVELWHPPQWTHHVVALLTLPAFVLLVAAYVPRNRIKATLGHPMLAGVKLWAFAHLLANGRLGDVLLFGGFLAWAVADFISARRRDRAAGTRYPAGTAARDAMAVAIGLVAWAWFAVSGHLWLIGVAPFA